MNASSHISFEILADIAENRVTGVALETAMAHVSVCSECDDTLRRLQHLVVMMRSDRSEDAPVDLLESAMDTFSGIENDCGTENSRTIDPSSDY